MLCALGTVLCLVVVVAGSVVLLVPPHAAAATAGSTASNIKRLGLESIKRW